MLNLKFTYERASDAAYLYLDGDIQRAVDQSRICEEVGDPVETVLDFDEAGRLVGIEFRNASMRLPQSLLSMAEDEPPPDDHDVTSNPA